jgi:membrane-associated progesterone receptor component
LITLHTSLAAPFVSQIRLSNSQAKRTVLVKTAQTPSDFIYFSEASERMQNGGEGGGEFPEINTEAFQAHLKEQGFTVSGKVGLHEVINLIKETLSDSFIGSFYRKFGNALGWIYAALKVSLDAFNALYSKIQEGSFGSALSDELAYFKANIATIGDLFQAVEMGHLPTTTVVFCITVTVILLSTLFFHRLVAVVESHDKMTSKKNYEGGQGSSGGSGGDKEEEEIVLRDFTLEQLATFNGTQKGGFGEPATPPVYISVKGNVYDCTEGPYGPGESYHMFAGREASRAFAKFSFDDKNLSCTDLSDLGPFERNQLDQWEDKFKYEKQYPVVGKCVFASTLVPPASVPIEELPVFSLEELAKFTGTAVRAVPAVDDKGPAVHPLLPAPSGRIHPPIYVAINKKVLDVSFGGVENYGPGGPYHRFAGRDASRALAKMSFKPEDINSRDLSDLTEEQVKTLQDWEKRFVEAKKYPIVGRLL